MFVKWRLIQTTIITAINKYVEKPEWSGTYSSCRDGYR